MELTADQRQALLDVARGVIRSLLGISCGQSLSFSEDAVLRQPAGCFVSLHTLDRHALRGCVGRLDSREELIESVRQAAASVLQDPRFVLSPVVLHELPNLSIEVTVIFPLRPAAHCLDFDLESDGIYLTINERSGCFLPQVARETGWTREQLLDRLCSEKLALRAGAWRETSPAVRLMKFHTLIIGPEPFEPLGASLIAAQQPPTPLAS